MSLALKLDRAREDLEYWQKIGEDLKLTPAMTLCVQGRQGKAVGLVASCSAALLFERYRWKRAFGHFVQKRLSSGLNYQDRQSRDIYGYSRLCIASRHSRRELTVLAASGRVKEL